MNPAKTWIVAFLALFSAVAANAQTNRPDDTAQSVQQWLHENLDVDTRDLFSQIHGAQDFFSELGQRFDGTNIYDLGSLKDVAVKILPVLKEYEETEPYGIWLEAHLDDFDVAAEMQRQMRTNNEVPGALNRMAAPPMKLERSIWVKELLKSPTPPLAKTYLPKLKEIFVAENVPPALVWVASVESSFNPKARSPAGAAGMFQLMPATARREHLSLWPFDQRCWPEKSAHAAAQYLRSLHNHYGDWPLALAAYNVGQGRVDKLLKEHKARNFDEIARWLPAETQMYVPKVEATIHQREGLALADLKPPSG